VAITKATTNKAIDEIKFEWNIHIAFIMRCRQVYYDQRELAHARPDLHCCMIADIMDQVKTSVPSFARWDKQFSGLWMLKQCLMGVKVHGKGLYHYIAHPRLGTGGGSNFTLECIVRTLQKLGDDSVDGKLPPHLYIQLDNCSGDNKNYVVTGFLNLLVAKGVFETIEVGYLPVGHTHEDIDQVFSVLSRKLKYMDVLSFVDFEAACRAAFTKEIDKPIVEYVNVKRDFKAWLENEDGVLYRTRVGIKQVRYMRITSFRRAKAFVMAELRDRAAKARAKEILRESEQLRNLRAELHELPARHAGNFPDEELEAYTERRGLLQVQLNETFDRLQVLKQEAATAPVLPSHPDPEVQLLRAEDDVVFHYKRQMDDPLYIPAYPGGVRYLLREPTGNPEVCAFAPNWLKTTTAVDLADDAVGAAGAAAQARPQPQGKRGKLGKSMFESIRDDVKKVIWHVAGLATAEHKAEWEHWIAEQDKEVADYVHELRWDLPTCTAREAILPVMNPVAASTDEIMVHEGFTNAARQQGLRAGRNAVRIAAEEEEARDFLPIAAGDFVLFWEAVIPDSELDAEQAGAFRGLSREELRCPVVMGVAMEDCAVTAPGHTLRVHRFRQYNGNLNQLFKKGVMEGDADWLMDVDRSSVLLINPSMACDAANAALAKQGRPQKPRVLKLSAATKKQLCELPLVGGRYEYVRGKGVVSKG
jgi:hypothetical protein